MTDNTTEGREDMDEPSQYGDGGAVAYGPDGEPVALLFAGGGGWKLPLERDAIEDEDGGEE